MRRDASGTDNVARQLNLRSTQELNWELGWPSELAGERRTAAAPAHASRAVTCSAAPSASVVELHKLATSLRCVSRPRTTLAWLVAASARSCAARAARCARPRQACGSACAACRAPAGCAWRRWTRSGRILCPIQPPAVGGSGRRHAAWLSRCGRRSKQLPRSRAPAAAASSVSGRMRVLHSRAAR